MIARDLAERHIDIPFILCGGYAATFFIPANFMISGSFIGQSQHHRHPDGVGGLNIAQVE
jgi:hypothetical protein